MITTNLKKNKCALMLGSLTLRKGGVLPALIICLIFSISSAWSHENYLAPINYDVSRGALFDKSFPTSVTAASCKSLLRSKSPTNSATDRTQRTAGKVAVLGVILGVRFALEPQIDNADMSTLKRNIKRHNNKIDKSPQSALSIAAFRKCQKEYILSKAVY